MTDLVDAPGRSDDRPWTAHAPGVRAPSVEMLDALAHLVADRPRGLVVAGWGAGVRPTTVLRFAEAAGWPVLADPLSNLRIPGTVATYDPLVRVPGFADDHRPDVVLRIGAPTTNKVVGQWLAPDVDQVLVDPDGAWLDPQHAASGRMVADPELLLGALADAVDVMVDHEWVARWTTADVRARTAIDELIDGWSEPFEGRVARDVVGALPEGAALVVASSMPVRDVESFARAREGVTFHANRGVNGIDGFVSTALGIAAGADAPTVALVGDLCFLHDSNGLLGAADRGVDATFVAAPAFLPVSLTAPAKSGETGCDRSDSEAPAADNRIEIELANGRRVRVGPGADMGALKRILDIVDGRQDHDPGSDRRAGVAGDRAHRHAQGLPVAVVAGPGGFAARSFERPSVLLSRTPGRPFEGDLA